MDWLTLLLAYGVPALLGIGVVAAIVSKARVLLVEIAEVLVEVDKALADGAVSKDEIAQIVNEAQDVWEAVKKFGQK